MKSNSAAARFVILEGPWLSVRQSLRAGEWLRSAVMSQAKKIFGPAIPWEISGRNPPAGSRHGQFFYFPEDSQGIGRIDGFFVYCRGGFNKSLAAPLKRLRHIQGRGETWQLALENFGSAEDFKGRSRLFGKSRLWRSRSPYLRPRHSKKNFALFDQIKEECAKRGWPDVGDIKLAPYLLKGERRLYPAAFHRFRSKEGLRQPDRHGGFWRLKFKEPVQGPVALGFGCHFGLGLFEAAAEAEGAGMADSEQPESLGKAS